MTPGGYITIVFCLLALAMVGWAAWLQFVGGGGDIADPQCVWRFLKWERGAGGRKLASLLWTKNSQPSRGGIRPAHNHFAANSITPYSHRDNFNGHHIISHCGTGVAFENSEEQRLVRAASGVPANLPVSVLTENAQRRSQNRVEQEAAATQARGSTKNHGGLTIPFCQTLSAGKNPFLHELTPELHNKPKARFLEGLIKSRQLRKL